MLVVKQTLCGNLLSSTLLKFLDQILKEAAEKDGQIKKLDQKIADINEKQLKPCQVLEQVARIHCYKQIVKLATF